MKKRRRLKKKPIIILICIIILIAVISVFTVNTINEMKYRKTIEYKLLNIGYSKDEISILQNKTNDEFMNSLLDKEYDKDYLEIVKEKYYIKEKLNDYIEYYEDNLDKKTNEIITLINTNAYKEHYTDIKESDISKNYQMINNKYYKLPEKYEPTDLVTIKNWYSYGSDNKLRKEAYEAFINMYNSAKEEKITLIINSAYRSYKEQEEVYNDYLTKHTKEYTDAYAARPGHSEHQTGLAIDIITYGANGDNFDETEAFTWLSNNAYKYGYILRYPKGKENITGYNYESWHYRYVGIDVATQIHNSNITFDEYYAYYIENVSN